MVERAEALLGVQLPADFREYLLRSNGGELKGEIDDWQIFPVIDDSDRKRAARSANHIVRETSKARLWPAFPPTAVAFAAD